LQQVWRVNQQLTIAQSSLPDDEGHFLQIPGTGFYRPNGIPVTKSTERNDGLRSHISRPHWVTLSFAKTKV